MAKLNILGAQRVKALIEILNAKEQEEIRELNRKINSTEITKQAEKEFGIDVKIEKLNALMEEAQVIADEIGEMKGVKFEIQKRTNYHYGKNQTDYQKRHTELTSEYGKEVKAVQEIYAEKRNNLWLCETLEEAKEIVGI